MFELLNGIGNQKMPTTLKDPFSKSKVNRIYVSFSCSVFYQDKWTARGTVEFSNGNTKGEQQFEGETFDDVVFQIKNFLKELK